MIRISKLLPYVCFVLCCLLPACNSHADPNQSTDGTKSGAATAASSKAAGRLTYTLGADGISSLACDGTPILGAIEKGHVRCFGDPKFQRADGTTYTASSYIPKSVSMDTGHETLTITYTWGTVACAYSQPASNVLGMRFTVTNRSADTLTGITLLALELGFTAQPDGNTLEAGMWGNGGGLHPLSDFPLAVTPEFQTPVIYVAYTQGAVAFCSDDPSKPTVVSVPFTDNPGVKTQYPFTVTIPGPIASGQSGSATVSLRFGPPGAAVDALAGDVIGKYRKLYPFQVRWTDHRPIGALFLASSGVTNPANPNRWIINYSGGNDSLSPSSPEGKTAFRKALLSYADGAVAVMKKYHAQGMITWDIEGEDYMQSVYYGDPLIMSTLAPEMEYRPTPSDPATVDAYFAKFRAAGLKVGVCVRAQPITFQNGVPIQGNADNEHAVQVLEDKIGYAHKRWGCTLFYVDSTVDGSGQPLDPDVFRQVADKFPDCLLIPENESQRYYAYTAPLNSYFHHGVTSTPPGARIVYPQAFSVLLAEDGAGDARQEQELAKAVSTGVILVFNAWFDNDAGPEIDRIYAEAEKMK